jgi:hypothetical protein
MSIGVSLGLQEKEHTGRAVLLALIHEIFVLASRGRFEAVAIDKLKLRKR